MLKNERKTGSPFTREGLLDLIGPVLAEKLVTAFSGYHLAIPRTESAKSFSEIVNLIGADAARILVAEREDRNREIHSRFNELTLKGKLSSRKAKFILGREFGLVGRSIERIVTPANLITISLNKMGANMQKVRTALEACRLALGKVACVKSVEWSLREATINLQPGHEAELALIDEALAELDRAGVPGGLVDPQTETP